MLTQSCGETGQYPFIHAVKLKKNDFSLSNAVVFSAIKQKKPRLMTIAVTYMNSVVQKKGNIISLNEN